MMSTVERRCLLRAIVITLLLATPASARGAELSADISDHLIAITTAFVGTTVTLFGTREGDSEIAVTVHGPREDQVVRRKAQVAGIWINRDQMTFADVPSFYAVASSAPLDPIARPDVRARLELGLDHLRLDPKRARGLEIDEVQAFRDALIRNKQREALFSDETGVVRFVGPRLFRTSIFFPANVPPGLYQVQVFELQDGQAIGAQRSTLVISKIGIEADLFDFAQQQSHFYGVAAILVAIAAGWLAGVIFRRS